ncbi:MAG: phosphatase PAP2 family protein [Streptococcaceae bacterium]|nr:phosphatase PAP2 family protein [Streptococcaceae bacterium]
MNKKLSYTIGTLSLLIFLVLLIAVKLNYKTSPMPFIDPAIQSWAHSLQGSHTLVSISSVIAKFLGDTIGAIVGLVVVILLFIFRQKAGALWLAITAVIAVGGNTVIKSVIGRVRPTEYRLPAFANESGKSFASGHSVFATVIFLCLFLILIQHIKSGFGKFILGLLAFGMIFLTMFSRVLIGVHYPSDTLAGFLLAVAIIAFTYPTFVKKNNKG